MRLVLGLTAAATAALVAACNANGPPPAGATAAYSGRQCFYAANAMGYRRGPGDTVIVNTNRRDYYQFETQPRCAERIDWENRIALRTRTGSFICDQFDAELYMPEAIGAPSCPLYNMHKLTPAEVAALKTSPPKR